MAFRTVEITGPAELHVKNGTLVIEKEIRSIEAGKSAENKVAARQRKTRQYFAVLCPEMNRREESPMNSRLNYGYSIIRNSLIRAVIAVGLLPSFGIHHQNLYNAYNLADDLIEPFRPCIDLIAYSMEGHETVLTRAERKQLASVLQHAVNMDGQKISVLQAVDKIANDYRNYVMEETEHISLPKILPTEIIRQIKE